MDTRALTALAEALPEGASVTLSRAELVELAAEIRADRLAPEPTAAVESPAPESWRERVWTVPAETRLTVGEAAEAMNRSRSWLYRRTGPAASDPIPHGKTASGVLTFRAGDIRDAIGAMEGERPRLRAVQ